MWKMAGAKGLEPSASGVTSRRYNQLNYAPASDHNCCKKYKYLNDFSQAKTEKNIFIEIIVNSMEKRSLDKAGFTDSPSLTPILVDVNAPVNISSTIGILIIPTCPKSSSLLLKSGSCAGINKKRIVPIMAPAVIQILE